MKTDLLIIIGCVVTLGFIGITVFPDSYGYCLYDEDGNVRTDVPCRGLPINPPHTLKHQILEKIPLHEIKCPNPDHVLTQRPNSNLACVTLHASEKLVWQLIKIN